MLGLSYKVDGKVWTNNAGNQDIYRVDLKTGDIRDIHAAQEIAGQRDAMSIYGIDSDSHNNLYFTEFLDN